MSAGAAAAVLVMAGAPRTGAVLRALEQLLGADGCLALHAELNRTALRVARQLAPGSVHIAYEPADAVEEVSERIFAHHSGPLLILWPDVPHLSPDHGAAALDDLRAGCDIVLGPEVGGGFYLLALAGPRPRLCDLAGDLWHRPDPMPLAVAAIRDAGLQVGMLRPERPLHDPADVRALLADPLAPPELRTVLSRAL